MEHGRRRDQLAETRHYDFWRRDFELCREIGARFVRYGPPYYRMHLGPGRYDWSWTDQVLPVMRELQLVPILDLCHFGVPDWVGGFQNADWPELFADYAGAFAARYPWLAYYTPVNEILVCSRYSAELGLWNEQLKGPRSMLQAVRNMCRATLLATRRILERVPEAVFFQSEVAEVVLERWPETHQDVLLANDLRFLTFDLLYGRPVSGRVLTYMFDHGLTREDYDWFIEHGQHADPHCVMGMDYYSNNERYILPDKRHVPCGPVLGWHGIGRQYHRRYGKPMMLTETNLIGAEAAPEWLWKTWQNAQMLRVEGIPVLGFTWYSLQDQVDWDIQLREIRGCVNDNGLYDLDRNPHPAAEAFQQVTRRYGTEPVLPQE